MNDNNIFLGCFVSGPSVHFDDDERTIETAEKQGEQFRAYIWGEKGDKSLSITLKKLKYQDYGNDLKTILFQFFVNPIPYQRMHLKEIENYRKNEKSIAISIIIDDENFFMKNENGRINFLKETILSKVEKLSEKIKRTKLDTDIDKL